MDGLELLTDDERSYFYEFETMFNSPGWERLMNEYKNERDAVPEDIFWGAKNYDDVVQARTRLAVLMELSKYPDIIQSRKDVIIKERQDALLEEAAHSQYE